MQKTVRARVIRVGKSRAIRIPDASLDQLRPGEVVELAVRRDAILVRRQRSAREGWAAAFQAAAARGRDRLLDENHGMQWDANEWQW